MFTEMLGPLFELQQHLLAEEWQKAVDVQEAKRDEQLLAHSTRSRPRPVETQECPNEPFSVTSAPARGRGR